MARSPEYEVGGVWVHDPWALSFGVPVNVHAGHKVRINTGFQTAIALPENASEAVSFLFPFGMYFQPVRIFFLGFDTGFGIADLHADSAYIPLRFTVGFTVPHRKHPVVDFTAHFGFPTLVAWHHGAVVHGDVWQLGAAASFYFQL